MHVVPTVLPQAVAVVFYVMLTMLLQALTTAVLWPSYPACNVLKGCGQAVLRDLEMPGNLEKMVNAVAYRGFAHLAAVPVLQV
eukprot:1159261-Pelagomonas_calceolata.AAC.9